MKLEPDATVCVTLIIILSSEHFTSNPFCMLNLIVSTCLNSFESKTVCLFIILITLPMNLKLKSKFRLLECFHGKINVLKSTMSYIAAYLS